MTNITINSLPTASTIDATQDILPIYTASSAATQGINRNTLLGLSSAPVGLTDSQTLTNKVLTSPTINGATLSGTLTGTYTIGGTPTFPSSVATLTGSQTLTNKVLTSPTINSPTITNATISTGSIYGISVTTGSISSNLSMTGTLGVTGLITATAGVSIPNGSTVKINSNPVWQYLGYAQITSSFSTASTSAVYATGLTVTATIPSGASKVRVTVYSPQLLIGSSAPKTASVTLWTGASAGTLTTQVQAWNYILSSSAPNGSGANLSYINPSPSSGSITYNVGFQSDGAGGITSSIVAASTSPAFIVVECC